MTTVSVPRSLRDRLAAIRPGKMSDTIAILLDDYDRRRNAERMAFEERMAAAQANSTARATGAAFAQHLIDLAAAQDAIR